MIDGKYWSAGHLREQDFQKNQPKTQFFGNGLSKTLVEEKTDGISRKSW